MNENWPRKKRHSVQVCATAMASSSATVIKQKEALKLENQIRLGPQFVLKPMNDSTNDEVLRLLKRLMNRDTCKAYFNEPVDHVALKLPNYPNVVRKPMDLGTIRDKLTQDKERGWDAKAYQYLEDFANDVRQVWKNGLFFNESKKNTINRIYDAAALLAHDFEKMLAELHSALSKHEPPCPKLLRAKLLLADVVRTHAQEPPLRNHSFPREPRPRPPAPTVLSPDSCLVAAPLHYVPTPIVTKHPSIRISG